ncbi:MAG: hypothetical protein FIB02_11550 [Desulfuromonas sp.]|nr:hypothetical protein [Desulfuromonas sp.]
MKRNQLHLFLLLVVLFLATACAKEQVRPRVFWPPLPERPRLEWLQNYYSQDDFPKTSTQATLEGFLGKPTLLYFARPFGVATRDDQGLVYVSDIDLKEVRVYDLRNYKIRLLNSVSQFGRPMGMTIDGRGNLYVCDGGEHTVKVFGPDNQPLSMIGSKDSLQNPVFVAVNDRLDRVYVSDGKAAKIVVFARNGEKLFEWGAYGGEPGQFRAPQGVAIDRDNRVFVADQLNARVQVFDADGKFLYMFGERADVIGGFEGPKGLAFDSEGNLHITDVRKSALMSYSPDGKLLLFTGGPGAASSPVGFSTPGGIWIDKNDKIYIADGFNRRFSVWQYLSDAYLAEHPIK